MNRGGARLTRGAGWLLTPYAAGVVALLLAPALMTFAYAFTNHTGLSAPAFTGLGNVRRALQDPFLADSLRASLIFVAMAVPLRLLLATVLGLALAGDARGRRWQRAMVYLPTIVPDVALALLFLWILNPVFGPLNQVLGAIGLPEPLWLATPWGARSAIVLMLAFPIGEAFLVVLAARRQVDPDLYLAARVDGATPWQQVRHITLPTLAPLLTLLAIRDTIMTLQVNFVPAYVLTDGGPDNATLFLPIYIYDHAFEFLGFGYAALLTLLLLAVTALLIAGQVVVARRWLHWS